MIMSAMIIRFIEQKICYVHLIFKLINLTLSIIYILNKYKKEEYLYLLDVRYPNQSHKFPSCARVNRSC